MFSKFYQSTVLCLLALLFSVPAIKAADEPVKREMRSAWVATVWRLDWPENVIYTTGSSSEINKQKASMTRLLDSLQVNNMNAINFQVRSRCDAMYKSSYEPWSSDLVSSRGMDPGWDPLEWVVEECHKRGMECHAWVNPYRYESQIGQWTLATDYRKTHPEWLLDVGEASILNPGLPEVTDQIVKVIREIVQNYDIDGVLFDDYFYLQGTPTDSSGDGDQYAAYVEGGGTLSHGDWRRDNVNRMVDAVYQMIQEEKPWVRFGISPAGVSCTTQAHAAKYGITPCTSGSDWQYSGIYSDPIAWIANHSLDYISPQVYWTIGYSSADFSIITPWWADVAAKFNRHFYTSHSISSLTASSKSTTMSMREATISDAINQVKASGPNSTSFEEFANEVRLNRSCSKDGAPGAIFYSCKYLYKTAPLFAHYLKTTVFNTQALVPAMTWKPGYNPGNVKNLSRSGNNLNWTGYDNVRYTIYAVPTSVAIENFAKEPEYLLGTSYATTYAIPSNKQSGYNYAVCVLDRYGNEYAPMFAGVAAKDMETPTLTFPANGSEVEMPMEFKWESVANATNYILEIANDAEFKSLLYTMECNSTSCPSTAFDKLPNQKLYWRVRACGNGYNDGVSAIWSFTATTFEITTPENGAAGVSLTPTIAWNIPNRKVTVEIATKPEFTEASMVHTASCNASPYTVPETVLGGCTSYYVRLAYENAGEQKYTETIAFTTLEVIPGAMVFKYPVDGGDFYSEDFIHIEYNEGVKSVKVEMSNATTFGRNRYIEDCAAGTWVTTTKAGDIKVSNKSLEVGKLYYIRVQGKYATMDGSANTEWTTISAYYRGEGAGVEGVVNDDANVYVNNENVVVFGDAESIEIYNAAGQLVEIENVEGVSTLDINYLAKGAYIIKVVAADNVVVLKYVK